MRSKALEVFKILEGSYGATDARTIIEYVENTDIMAIERVLNGKLDHLATKRDVEALRREFLSSGENTKNEFKAIREEVAAFKEEVKNEFKAIREEVAAFKEEVKNEFKAVREEATLFKEEVRNEFKAVREEAALFKEEMRNEFKTVRSEMSHNKADLMKWMFVFWAGQLIATFSFILLFIKK
ncbi:DUF1640 domain-containing protein [Chitinophaga agrisoli]|uniref:DUF1640 domain-containing protein n=1 Tax=Chitinophaga agrisoli TaxID=2607653 RepID=A0A5B2VY68_9BACT|nr:DUF1640 domain-containing protein [Chitinophaga agrisoli]KAA2243764.1 DUF1640 domain-containing protein [Chitinophaga agrisoli]